MRAHWLKVVLLFSYKAITQDRSVESYVFILRRCPSKRALAEQVTKTDRLRLLFVLCKSILYSVSTGEAGIVIRMRYVVLLRG